MTGAQTYTATFSQAVNNYTVTFKNWDATTIGTPQSIAYGSGATAPPDPTRAADAHYTYTFAAWDVAFSNIT